MAIFPRATSAYFQSNIFIQALYFIYDDTDELKIFSHCDGFIAQQNAKKQDSGGLCALLICFE